MINLHLKHHAEFLLNVVATLYSKCNYRSNFDTNQLIFYRYLVPNCLKFSGHFFFNSDNKSRFWFHVF